MSRSSITLVCLAAALWVFVTSAAGQTQEWVARYGSSISGVRTTVLDAHGNVYVCADNGGGSVTLKYDASGVFQWAAFNGGAVALAVAVDDSGNVYVTGSSGGNFLTVKYNSEGEQQWVRDYDGPVHGSDYPSDIAVDGGGNVFVTGQSQRTVGDGADVDFLTIKYDPSGNREWVRRYNGPAFGDDVANALALDPWGSLIVTGQSKGIGTEYDFVTISYSTDGVQQWLRRYNGDEWGDDYSYDTAVDSAGNIYVTGWSDGGLESRTDWLTIKYAPDGHEEWVRRFDDEIHQNDYAFRIALDSSGNPIVTGIAEGYPDLSHLAMKYDSDGNVIWAKRIAGAFADGLAVDDLDCVYAASTDNRLSKLDADGVHQWTAALPNGGPSYGGGGVAVDALKNVYLTGTGPATPSGTAVVIVKYSQPPPSFNQPLESQTSCLGRWVLFLANAEGTPRLHYQWRKNGVNLHDGGRISGATTAALLLDPVGFADAGAYDVVVTNDLGTATSNAAALEVFDECDVNCDGSINQFDIQPFVEKLSPDSPTPCAECVGDANGDGSINQFDIQGFVECLSSP